MKKSKKPKPTPGQAMEAAREAKGLKQNQAAALADISPIDVWRIEHGIRAATVIKWLLYARAIGVEPFALLE